VQSIHNTMYVSQKYLYLVGDSFPVFQLLGLPSVLKISVHLKILCTLILNR